MIWDRLATTEFAGLDRRMPVILPIAAVEQHGAHLPLSVDCDIGSHFLAEAETRFGEDMLILPQIRVACSQHHMDFAGTLTVQSETFLAYAADLLESVIAHGFDRILIFNSHGGNRAIGHVLADKIGVRHRHCHVVMSTWWTLAGKALEPLQESAHGGVAHACEFETSVMMLAHPDKVRQDQITTMSHVATHEWAQEDMLHAARALLFRTMHEKSGGTGTVGDPSKASAEKGARITETVIDALRMVVRDLKAARPRRLVGEAP
ncbi:creatininase family protein [Pararhizobium haloflavum]|uniref:creatininase family protein n=1 Tax=Pararhizobium haloflavum TaxID=2037914 RepID=UPI000C183418|nr:creatininase family protein [Pararhizobium haloflavum]